MTRINDVLTEALAYLDTENRRYKLGHTCMMIEPQGEIVQTMTYKVFDQRGVRVDRGHGIIRASKLEGGLRSE